MENIINDEKKGEIKDKNLYIPNEEILTNFDFNKIFNSKITANNLFFTNYSYSIKNILRIKKDHQGSFWNGLRGRAECFLQYLDSFEPFRCEEITAEEKKIKKFYKSIKKYDDIYQFKKYIKVGKTYICHFQIRKNILHNNKYLIYNKKFSIEIYDLIKNKRQTLIGIDEDQLDGIICFDVYHNNEQFLICYGNDKGNCDIFSVKQNDFIKCLEFKNNITPKFSKNFSLSVSENINNNNALNNNENLDDSNNAALFINYVKFISQNNLITTSNDCHFKIIDLDKNIEKQKYKNNFEINHCDINHDKNTLLCIGDSKVINIVDLRSNKNINTLNEHFDYGIVIKFNPYNNIYFASGNQDMGCKIWDIRNLNNGSVLTSWGINDCIGDLDWIDSRTLCFMENSFFSHIFDIKSNKIQDLMFNGYGNGIVHDKLNNNIYINIFKGNEDDTGGILIYEKLNNKVMNSFNNINL